MDERCCFVQFIHPGREHLPDRGEEKDWNTKEAHRRKFLKSRGRYLANGKIDENEIEFWGEWEPQSRVVTTYGQPKPDGPRFLYAPYYALLPEGTECQNTDPFVFGECFHYTGCLQHTKRGPTQLRYLAPGSVVLFGSCKAGQYLLDTVFVVAHHIDHSRSDWKSRLEGKISSTYRKVTIEPWYKGDQPIGQSHRLYFGATPENPVCGMYSFFPCQLFGEGELGFPRPSVELCESITPTLRQGKKITRDVSLTDNAGLWKKVVRQVEKKGFMIGVHAELPPKCAPGR